MRRIFEDVLNDKAFESWQAAADEYKDQFCSCNQPVVADPSQLSLPLEHHTDASTPTV